MMNHFEIVEWTDTTFGPASSNFRVVTRANEELAEALRAIAAGHVENSLFEAADTIITLCRPARAFGLNWGSFGTEDSELLPEFHVLASYFTFANAFMSRLLNALAQDDNHRDAKMLIENVYRCLAAAIFKCHATPQGVIAGKMLINLQRRWSKVGDGTGYHVRDKSKDATEIERNRCLRIIEFVGVPANGHPQIDAPTISDARRVWGHIIRAGGDIDVPAIGPGGEQPEHVA